MVGMLYCLAVLHRRIGLILILVKRWSSMVLDCGRTAKEARVQNKMHPFIDPQRPLEKILTG